MLIEVTLHPFLLPLDATDIRNILRERERGREREGESERERERGGRERKSFLMTPFYQDC